MNSTVIFAKTILSVKFEINLMLFIKIFFFFQKYLLCLFYQFFYFEEP